MLRSINGRMLLELTDEQMKKGLHILPLGHRQTLHKKIKVRAGPPGTLPPAPSAHTRASQRTASPMRGPHYALVHARTCAASCTYPHPPTHPRTLQELKQLTEGMGEDNSTKQRRHAGDGRHPPRMPASASPNIIPPDSFLGPAQVGGAWRMMG